MISTITTVGNAITDVETAEYLDYVSARNRLADEMIRTGAVSEDTQALADVTLIAAQRAARQPYRATVCLP